MEKLLSICIPTYNMEALLSRCLDSFIIEKEYMEMLEVIIVNDGSKDNSSKIAHEYAEKYPNTYVVIDKLNGNYGSCVNVALKNAMGKYFRLVDADDWVKSNNLKNFLDALCECNEEIVYTNFAKRFIDDKKIENSLKNGILYNHSYDLTKDIIPINTIAMHGITIKTQFLKDIKYIQTEGISYTDSEFVFYPLAQALTMRCLDIEIYQYFIGRIEQTMSSESLVKNYNNFEKLYQNFLRFEPLTPNNNFKYLKEIYLYRMISYMVDILVIYGGYIKERDLKLRGYMKELSIDNPSVFLKLKEKTIVKVPYARIWYENKNIGFLFIQIVRFLRWLKKNLRNG